MRPRLALRKEARGACGDTTRAVRSGGDRRNHLAAVDGDAAPIGWRKSGATGLLPGLFARCVTVVWLAATDKEAGAHTDAGKAHARITEVSGDRRGDCADLAASSTGPQAPPAEPSAKHLRVFQLSKQNTT